MAGKKQDFKLEATVEPSTVPKRVAFIKKDFSAQVKEREEDLVMSYPDLLLRLLVGLEILMIVLAILSLLINAPLLELANPDHTPNPAKAPWYFLGIQELLHLFPPLVAGVLIPTLVVIALIVIPYFQINIKREGLWKNQPRVTLIWLTAIILALVIMVTFFRAFSIAIPTIAIYGLMILPYIIKKQTGLIGWLGQLSLPEWIMIWFVLVTGILTTIGILFRGPGWEWTWPWQGIY
jgi:menaquinol-cytochrome c reductase cytochrome b/c subunit